MSNDKIDFCLKDFKNILFDLDGTLSDPKEGIINSYKYALKKLNIDEENPDSLTEFIGTSLQNCFTNKYGLKDNELSSAIIYYREYFSEKGAYENKLYDGVEELLQTLHSKNKKLFVVTTKAKVFAERIIRHFNISQYFENVYGSELKRMSDINKEKKEHICDALKNEKLKAGETIMVGDRKFDITGAKENGIKSIAVTYGFGSLEELNKAQPDYSVSTIQELYDLLCNKGN